MMKVQGSDTTMLTEKQMTAPQKLPALLTSKSSLLTYKVLHIA
jgi:hypothetical protein